MKEYKVTEQTSLYLEAIQEAQNLYDKVANAITNHYGEEQLDKIIDEFNEAYQRLQAELYQLLNDSIKENLATLSNEGGKV